MTDSPQAFGRHYLHMAHIDAFGALYQRNIGPFSEGLNVVYGANEAGKTTATSFIGGVLFGWPDARSDRNSYKPAGAQRSGNLTFAPREGIQGEHDIVCARDKNADGIKPDPHPSVLADIDEASYRTVFSLNSEELLSLGRGGDITSHLLTAGAGTAVSPTQALNDINARLNNCFSRAAQYTNSVPNVEAELARTAEALEAVAEEAQTFKKEAREYAELKPQVAEAENRLAVLNDEVSRLTAASSTIERLQQEAAQLTEEEDELRVRELGQTKAAGQSEAFVAMAHVDEARLRAAKEELEELAVRDARLNDESEQAQDDYRQAKAHFAFVADSGAHLRLQAAQQRKRTVLSVLGFALPAIFAIAALFLFVLSRDSASTAPFVGAVIFAVAALVSAGLCSYLLSQTGTQVSAEEFALEEATRDLDAAEQKMAVVEEKLEAHHAQLADMLASLGLESADGNIRYARALIEGVRDERMAQQHAEQQRASLELERANLEAKKSRNAQELADAFEQLGLSPLTKLAAIQDELAAKTSERDALQTSYAQKSDRCGALKVELDRAEHLADFDKLKIEHAQLQTRLEETKSDYAQLLLVRRLLERAITAWEDKSQPEVYRQAGELLSTMTGGNWCEVRMDENDKLVVVDAFGQVREPQFLSLGTCQQLYLALRVALLMTAENVGRSIPILADDILVNFDAQRRVGAAQALEALSRVRQVIVFTCHEEVVQLMQESCDNLNIVEL